MDDKERQQLNREIAEALGWRVGQYTDYSFQGADTFTATALIRPDGSMAWFHPLVEPTEDECWKHVPDYAADLNAVADALPNDMDIEIHTHGGKMITAFIWWYDAVVDETHRFQAAGADRKEAAARALKAWAQSKVNTP